MGILEASLLTNKYTKPIADEILKTKNTIIKSLLSLMKHVNKNILESYHNWHYYFPLNIIKRVMLRMGRSDIKNRSSYIENMFEKIKDAIAMRVSC